jgi:YVTN family beta-propeller protein
MPWRAVMLSWRNLPRVFIYVFFLLSIFLFQTSVYSDDDKIDIALENDPRMVAVNPVTNRAVVTHWHSNYVSIVDLNTERVIAKLRVGKLPRGVAIDTETNTAVITNQADRSLTLINLNTNKVTATVDLDRIPSNIAVNSQTHIAAVTSAIDQHVFFVDLTARRIVAKTHIASMPEM